MKDFLRASSHFLHSLVRATGFRHDSVATAPSYFSSSQFPHQLVARARVLHLLRKHATNPLAGERFQNPKVFVYEIVNAVGKAGTVPFGFGSVFAAS